MENPKLEVGQVFTNIYDFRVVIRIFSIKHSFEVKFKKKGQK